MVWTYSNLLMKYLSKPINSSTFNKLQEWSLDGKGMKNIRAKIENPIHFGPKGRLNR